MDPPSLGDSVESYVGPTSSAASLPHEDEYYRSSVALSSGETMRPPSPWLDPRLSLPKRGHDVNGQEIDPASIAFSPEIGKFGRNLHQQIHQRDATIVDNPRLQYPDATPKEWQQGTPVSAVSPTATLRSAIRRPRSKRRVTEDVDDADTRRSKRRKGSAAALQLVSPSSKKRTVTDNFSWQRKFRLLCAFQSENGHCRVPTSFVVDSISLGQWVSDQRHYYKKYMEGKAASITEERIAHLNSIGFEWRPKDTWQHNFELLCAFQSKNGHCRVPYSFVVDSTKLGQWVHTQRHFYKKYKEGKAASITEERISHLNSIGFEWRLQQTKGDTWRHKFELLCAFQSKNGHCRVPYSFVVDSIKLGRWVNEQRQFYKKYKEGKAASITEEHISQLNSIGFEWRPKETKSDVWQHNFELLCAFQSKNGHCRVPCSFVVDSIKLGQWVHTQRHFYKKYKEGKAASITEERIAQLNSVGFEWRLPAPETDSSTWQHNFEHLCAFQRENGHCRVPYSFVVDSIKLGKWVHKQRGYYSSSIEGKRCITDDRLAQLNSIGFEWQPKGRITDNDTWQNKFELLCTFQSENGHCRVPNDFVVDSINLGQWVHNQRHLCKRYKEGKAAAITEERIAQLNSIGLEWRLKDTWQHKFELLCAFQSKNGHCRVPYDFVVDSINLGQWVHNQRHLCKKYREGKAASITEERIAQLNSIGLEWKMKEKIDSDAWQHKFELLCSFQCKNGHCRVPGRYIVDSILLGKWVGDQRKFYKKYKDGKAAPITEELIAQLNSIGFEWILKEKTDSDTWQHKFEHL